MFEHIVELVVDVPMPTAIGSTSSKKIMIGPWSDVYETIAMLMVLAFAAMTSVQAAGLNNNTYEYATVFIPNGGPVFVYSAVSNDFINQRVNIQHLNIFQ